MKKLRKFLNASVMVMTILAMSGLGMFSPNFANAAASAGDLIKMEGNTSVYYFDGAKRFVFPNEATYFSWYSDFSGVVTIPSSELQSYLLGGNVVMRPGTKLVKITTDPKVYAVEANGVLRHVQTEAQAIALYGSNWATRVVDVPDAFFTNYSIGTPLASGNVPAGSLVKNAGSSSVYYFDGTNYRMIGSEAAMTANRLSFNNVLTISNAITAGGNAITGMESALVKTSQGGATGPVVTGSGLMVSLNSSTPVSQAVPQTASRVPFSKVNLTAANDGSVTVDSITVKRTGLTGNANGIKVWAEKEGVSLSSKRTLSNDEAILIFTPALFVPAGQTITIDVLAELNAVTGNGALGIVSASAVSATAAAVTGSFPITGNLMSFTDYNVAKLDFDGNNGSYTVKVGDENVELGKFNIDFGNVSRDVVVSSLSLRNAGLEDLKDVVMNLYLENSGKKVSHNATFDGRYATFKMMDGGMEMLKDDGNQSFTIKGDVIGKNSIGTGNSIELSLNKAEELVAHEKATGFGIIPTVTGGKEVSSIVIEAGNVSVSKKSTSPSGEETVIANAKGVVVLLANIKADEMISAEGLVVDYSGTGTTTDSLIWYTDAFSNIKVYLNNVLLDSFDPELTSSKNFTTGADANTREIESAFTLNKGDNEVKITVDVKSNAKAGYTFSATLDADTHSDFLEMPEYVSNGNAVNNVDGKATGATIKVAGAQLDVANNDGYENNRPVVQGTDDVSLGKFAVKATNDKATITSVKVGVNTGDAASTTVANISGMKLFVDGQQVGTTRNFTSTGAEFTGLSFDIAQNTTKVFELKGNFSSSAAGDTFTNFKANVAFSANDSLGKNITTGTRSANTTQFKVTKGGTLSVAAGASTPNSTILVAKAGIEQEVAQFTLTSVNDSSNIKEIAITNSASTKTDRVSSYKLYVGSILIDTVTPFGHDATFYITNDKLIVPSNGTTDIVIKAIFNDIGVADQTGKDLKVRIVSMDAKSSNGTTIAGLTALNKDAKEMAIRKTKPTFSKVSGIVGDAGGEQEMVRFTVTADSNEKLRLDTLVFLFEGNASGTEAIEGKTAKLYEVGDSTAKATATVSATSSATFAPEVEVSGTKTFYVVANTNTMPKDARVGITLNTSENTNVIWKEYFVSGYAGVTAANALYLTAFPISGGSMTY